MIKIKIIISLKGGLVALEINGVKSKTLSRIVSIIITLYHFEINQGSFNFPRIVS